MMENERFEKLAAWFHDIWAGWYKYQRDKATPENIERWERQSRLPYSELSEDEKNSDRYLARCVPVIVETRVLEHVAPDHVFAMRAVSLLKAYHAEHRKDRREVHALRCERSGLLQAADGSANARINLEDEIERLRARVAELEKNEKDVLPCKPVVRRVAFPPCLMEAMRNYIRRENPDKEDS